jgi:hypothetical protein
MGLRDAEALVAVLIMLTIADLGPTLMVVS